MGRRSFPLVGVSAFVRGEAHRVVLAATGSPHILLLSRLQILPYKKQVPIPALLAMIA